MANAPRLLFATVNFTDTIAQWSESGFAANKTYRWRANLGIIQQDHNDPNTNTANLYNGLDVQEGDYFSTTINARILKIITIEAQSETNVQAIVEDDDLVNILSSPNGEGIIPDSEAIIFKLDNEGMPQLFPLPAILPAHFNRGFAEEIVSRFRWRGSGTTITVEKTNHNFNVGRAIYLDPTLGYNHDDNGEPVGIIEEIGYPGVDYFRFRPFGKIVKIQLAGAVGTLYFRDITIPGGFLTDQQPNVSETPILIKIDDDTALTITGISKNIVAQNPGQVAQAKDLIVVSNIAARDALTPVQGLLVFVRNSDADIGTSDYSLWIYDNGYKLIQTADTIEPKDRVAKTYNLTGLTGSSSLDIMDIERQSAVQSITIRVTQPFTTGTVTVGEQGDPDKYADEDNFDITSIGTYISRVPTYRDDFNEGKLKLFYNNLTGSGEFTVLAVVA